LARNIQREQLKCGSLPLIFRNFPRSVLEGVGGFFAWLGLRIHEVARKKENTHLVCQACRLCRRNSAASLCRKPQRHSRSSPLAVAKRRIPGLGGESPISLSTGSIHAAFRGPLSAAIGAQLNREFQWRRFIFAENDLSHPQRMDADNQRPCDYAQIWLTYSGIRENSS
jgi:hypothetical protein